MPSANDPMQTIVELYARGAYADALAFAVPLLARRHKKNVELMNVAAACARAQGDLIEAEALWRRAVTLNPAFADGHCNLGLVLKDMGRYKSAENACRRALKLQPRHVDALNNLGNLLKSSGRFAEAEVAYRKIIRIQPDHAGAYNNLGNLLRDLGRDAEAEATYRSGMALRPDFSETEMNLGALKLAQGDFTAGWSHHEARCLAPGMPQPSAGCPRWTGQELTGKSLLIGPELGFGDEIQFVRYLPLLKAAGARHITLVCRRPLKALFETLSGVDRLLAADEPAAANLPLHDYWSLLLSIPRYLGTDAHSIPATLPYLHALPERIAHWRSRLPASGFRVGLVWQGNRQHRNDHHRSLADLAVLRPLWKVPGTAFVSLQKEPERFLASPAEQPLLSLGPELRDFADTAALIAGLDLVISVDTSVAHLAGALGQPCWVLLPMMGTDWRWLRQRDDSPWYPRVMRLFRQTDPRDWTSTVATLAAALHERVHPS